MDLQNFSNFKTFLSEFIVTFIFMTTLANQTLSIDSKFEACAPRTCGDGLNISYPFWISSEQESYCGLPNFGITCKNQSSVLNISNDDYIIKDIFYANNSILVANFAAYEDTCPTPLHNFNLRETSFNGSSAGADLFFLYNCTEKPPENVTYPMSCASNGTKYSFAVFNKDLLVNESYKLDESCQSIVYVPVDVESSGYNFSSSQMNYAEILKMGFLLKWTADNCSSCEASDGRCGFENNEFVCFCQDKPHPRTCVEASRRRVVGLKVGIGCSASAVGLIIIAIFFFIYYRRNKKKHVLSSHVSSSKISSGNSSSVLDLDMVDKLNGVDVFTYAELEEATDNFDNSKALGVGFPGRFPTVYYGKLRDGREVAVKRLHENKPNRIEKFINEVKILAPLHHENLVSLYGCASRHNHELFIVYEFIPNGTLADHLHGQRANSSKLPWPARLKIAIETANALTYLHASDIIHRDVKTDNILLDNDFCVKIADFGLSRPYPVDATHVTTAPQGTSGYLDPEYYRYCCLSDKSDVFSFGVVLIELISSLPLCDFRRNGIDLSRIGMTKISLHEHADSTLGFDSDNQVRMMIIAVAELALQCLEKRRQPRPYMADVLETLKRIQRNGL